MATPRVMVLRVPGAYSDQETRYALELAGAKAEIRSLGWMAEELQPLHNFQALVLPGGSSYADCFSPGRMWAAKLNHILYPRLDAFLGKGGFVIGINNGFQALVQAGWLPESKWRDSHDRDISLLLNASGRYESFWPRCLVPATTLCPLFEPGEVWEFPLTCSCGRLAERTAGQMAHWLDSGFVTLRYAARDGSGPAAEEGDNPTGSILAVAGLCDRTGRIMGMMLSPERCLTAENHPRWRREKSSGEGDGLKWFRRMVKILS